MLRENSQLDTRAEKYRLNYAGRVPSYWNAIYKCKWVALSWYVQLRGYEILPCRNILLSSRLSLSFAPTFSIVFSKKAKVFQLMIYDGLNAWRGYRMNSVCRCLRQVNRGFSSRRPDNRGKKNFIYDFCGGMELCTSELRMRLKIRSCANFSEWSPCFWTSWKLSLFVFFFYFFFFLRERLRLRVCRHYLLYFRFPNAYLFSRVLPCLKSPRWI